MREKYRMQIINRALVPCAALAALVSACGGGPDLARVRADFESPSGLTKDKQGVIAASGKQTTSGTGSALSLAGNGVPGFGLVDGRGSHAFASIAPSGVVRRQMAEYVRQARGQRLDHLRTHDGADACFGEIDQQKLARFGQALQSGGNAKLEHSGTANFSSCSRELTGSAKFSMKIEVRNGTQMKAEIEYALNEVCQKADNSCVDGELAMEMEMNLDENALEGLGNLRYVGAWDLVLTGNGESGARETISSKGGVRFGFSTSSSGQEQASFEYLHYVKDSSGKEVSYVFSLRSDGGTTMLAIRGADGELTCSFNEASGEGQCQGTVDGEAFDLSWTDADFAEVTSSAAYRE
jgi:hypothetical protein